MAQVFQRYDSLPLKSLNSPQAVKNWSNEDLVDRNQEGRILHLSRNRQIGPGQEESSYGAQSSDLESH